jgi:hypothetical protein
MKRLKRKAAALSKARRSRPKRKRPKIETTVVISIERGIADVTHHSGAPCQVVIRDYDIDGMDGESVSADPDGRRCLVQVVRYP